MLVYKYMRFIFRNRQKEIDETVSCIKHLISRGELKDGDYKFLSYLLSRSSLDHRDINITALTLLADGLNAVNNYLISFYLWLPP